MRSYLTDDELKQFIENIEQQPLYAPGHLREEIMRSLKKQDIISVQKLRQAKIQMFTYSVKITAGMAAALFFLFMLSRMPMDYLRNGLPEYRQRETSWEVGNRLEDALQKGTEAIHATSDKVFDTIMSFNRLFEKED